MEIVDYSSIDCTIWDRLYSDKLYSFLYRYYTIFLSIFETYQKKVEIVHLLTPFLSSQTSPLDVNLPSFRSTQLQTKEDIPLTFVHQVVIILRVAFHQFPSAQQGIVRCSSNHCSMGEDCFYILIAYLLQPLKVENVKVVELIVSTLSILASLCRDRRLLEEVRKEGLE